MGVSLERVQYKFASIIGELCSEPVVLSQFAVWLDLRLAEYKLRGAISLDCSGSKPDPVWLKGLQDESPGPKTGIGVSREVTSQGPSEEVHVSLNSSGKTWSQKRAQHSISQTQPGGSDVGVFPSTSADADLEVLEIPDIVIKQEPDDGFPISVHINESGAPAFSSTPLKRPVTDKNYPVAHKHRKIDDSRTGLSDTSSTSHYKSVTESLTSILGVGYQEEESHDSKFDTNDVHATVQQNTVSQVQDDLGRQSGMDWLVTESTFSKKNTVLTGEQHPFQGLPKEGGKLSAFQRNTMNTVNIFERWLQDGLFNEFRKIYRIPAEELDTYLADFFSTTRRQNGDDYKPSSFEALRKFLQVYLKEKGYPYSITTSPCFSKTQLAFKDRLHKLQSNRELWEPPSTI